MDMDWCLTCNRHIEEGMDSAPYCSYDCRLSAGPSRFAEEYYYESCFDDELDDEEDDVDFSDEPIYHTVDDVPASPYTGNDYSGIAAWAAGVSAGPPAEEPPRIRRKTSHSSSSPRPSHSSPNSVATVTYRPPELLRSHHPAPATLCMSKPRTTPSSPSRPIVTPQQQIAEFSAAYSGGTSSTCPTSLLSGATESSLATPASSNPLPFSDRKPSVLDSIASHVRSWVAPSPQVPSPPQSHAKFSQPPSPYGHSALKISTSPDDEINSVRWSSTLVLKTPSKPSRNHRLAVEIPGSRDDQPSYRARGRKASRAVA